MHSIMCNIQPIGVRSGTNHRNSSQSMTAQASNYFCGLDFGTSGARITVIDDSSSIVSDSKLTYPELTASSSWPLIWEDTLSSLLQSVPNEIRQRTRAIAIDGTSATSLLVDGHSGRMLAPPKLYNEAQSSAVVECVKALAPPSHTTTASTSTLCKLIAWTQEGKWQGERQPRLLHQADWLASLLHGNIDEGVTDWNNALKLGFDPGSEKYPEWLMKHEFSILLPKKVLPPGTVIGPVRHSTSPASTRGSFPSPASQALPTSCMVVSGTTDSISAFIAAQVDRPGQAVTSLGSTLAVKMISETRVDNADFGVYSHRLSDGSWLVGGASNTGGAVLRSLFTDQELRELTEAIKARGFGTRTGLRYYPLLKPGERFPINDPKMQPVLLPRPHDDSLFLQGIFESLARIEGEAYRLLERLGATPVKEVLTAGGGSVNEVWMKMRETEIGVPVRKAEQGEASYGSALLARQGFIKHTTFPAVSC